MPRDLIRRAIEESASREPVVHAMALLYASRALAAFDRQAAREVFVEGAAAAARVVVTPHVRDIMLNEAVHLGCLADPVSAAAFFRAVPQRQGVAYTGNLGMILRTLAEAGEIETAVSLLETPGRDLLGTDAVIRGTADPVLKRRAMLAARERWLELRKDPVSLPLRNHSEYYRLLSVHWTIWDRADAERLLREAVAAVENDPSGATNAQFGKDVKLYSDRDVHLFLLLNVLRALWPPAEIEWLLSGTLP